MKLEPHEVSLCLVALEALKSNCVRNGAKAPFPEVERGYARMAMECDQLAYKLKGGKVA